MGCEIGGDCTASLFAQDLSLLESRAPANVEAREESGGGLVDSAQGEFQSYGKVSVQLVETKDNETIVPSQKEVLVSMHGWTEKFPPGAQSYVKLTPENELLKVERIGRRVEVTVSPLPTSAVSQADASLRTASTLTFMFMQSKVPARDVFVRTAYVAETGPLGNLIGSPKGPGTPMAFTSEVPMSAATTATNSATNQG